MRSTLPAALLIATALLGAALGATAQSSGAQPEVKEEKDKIVLQNDDITVWFHGKKPMLKVFPTGDAEGNVSFGVKFHRVVEYRDLDANGLPAETEILSTLNLERASAWTVNSTEENGTITLTLKLESDVRPANGNVLPDDVALPASRAANVALVFTISGAAFDVDAGDVNLTVPTSAVKYDFIVKQWPTVQGADSRLALEAHVDGALVDDDVLGLAGATVEGNGTGVGVLAWTDGATGTTLDGENATIPVRTETEPLADAEAGADAAANATIMTRVVHTFDVADLATLVYDPVIGLATTANGGAPGDLTGADGEATNPVPGAGTLLVAAAVAGAAAIVARRRG